MKTVVINAAPRMEAGNTQMILTPFLVGMRERGAKVDIAILARKNIQRCIGCFTCYATTPGVCIHDDDMPALEKRIRAADLMILATPVYLDGMTSWAKTLLDRMVTFLDPHFISDEKGFAHPLRWPFPKKMFLVSVCGYPGMHNFDPLLIHMERAAHNFHSEFCGALLRPAIFSLLFTKKYPDRVRRIMDAVRHAGQELVTLGRVSQETQDVVAEEICSPEELMATANAYWDRELASSGDEPA